MMFKLRDVWIFSSDRVSRIDNVRDVSMAPLDFSYMPASEYMDRYEGITSELNVNMVD